MAQAATVASNRRSRRWSFSEDGWILPEVTNLDHRLAIGHVDDGPLESLIDPYFEERYWEFDAFCRSAYAEVLPTWPSVLVPWDQILAERSEHWTGASASAEDTIPGCGVCESPTADGPDVPLVLEAARRAGGHHRLTRHRLDCLSRGC